MFGSRARRMSWLVLPMAVVLAAGCSTAAPAPGAPGSGAAGGGAAPSAAAPPGEAMPKRGGVYNLSAGGTSYGNTDPAMGQASYNVWPVIGEYLLRAEPETWKLAPSTIESWQFSPDGLTLTLNVRKGVKFHNKPPVNGREVEAKDIIYTLKTVTGQLYPQFPTVKFPRRSQFEQMKDAVAVDKYTVQVILTEPSLDFLQALSEYRAAIVVPDQIREAFGGPESMLNPDVAKYISAGPFIFTKFTNTVEAEYQRNPDYWELAADGKPKPYLDAIRYTWIPDKATENAAFIAGQIDTVGFRNNQDRDLILGRRKDATVLTYAPSSCWYRLGFNMTRKPFDDVRVRKAIALVLDPVETGKQLYGDWEGKPLWRYPGPLPWVFPEAIPQEELAKLPGYRLPKDQDIAEARRLLKEAGVGDGLQFEIQFEMLTMANLMEEYAQLAQNQIQRALPGVKITLKVVDNTIQQKLAAEGTYDAQYYCYIHESNAVGMMKTAYHSKGGRNYPRFSDQQMDDLLDQAGRELNMEKRFQLLRQAQMRALELVPFMPTFHYATQTAIAPHMRGLRYGAATAVQLWYKDTWIDK